MLYQFVILFLAATCFGQVTKPVQVYSVSGQLQWPPNFFMTNVFAAGGTTLSFDLLGRMTISSASGSGTNTLFQTNGVSLGQAGTVNWTTGVTGYLAGAVANLGVNVSPSGGGVAVADLLVVSNQLQTASNKFQTDVSNLQGATNGLHTRVGNLEGATNSFNTTNANLATHINNIATNTIKWLTNIWGDVARGFGGLANNQVLTYDSSSGTWTNKTPTSGGTPAGNNGDIQFNESGAFAGTNQFNFVRATPSVELQGGINTAFFLGYSNGVAGFTNRFRTIDLTVITPGVPQYGLKLGNAFATSLGGWVIITNSFYPNISNHTDLGWSEFVWKSNWVNHLIANQSIRLGATNGGSGTIFSNAGIWRPTNVFVFNITNPVSGQILKFHSVTYGGATATIILTNDVDNTGGGGSSLQTNDNHFGPNPVLTLNTGLFVTNMTVYDFLRLSNGTAPPRPITNHLYVGKDSYAGRGFLETWDDQGLSIAYQPFLGNNRVHMILPGTTATTVSGYGMATPTGLGSVTFSQPPPTEDWPLMMQLATAATSNACAGVFTAQDMTTMGTRAGANGYFLATEFMTTNLLVTNTLQAPAGNRLFIGRTSTANPNLTNIVNTTNGTGQYAGLYADCGNSAQFFLSVRDGTAEFRTNTGMFWRATNLYQFYMMQAPTSQFLAWKLKDITAGITTEGWFSNNVPTNMMKAGYLIRNGTTVVHSVRFNKLYIEAPLSP